MRFNDGAADAKSHAGAVGLGVKKVSEIWSICCGGSPTPVSLTETGSCSFPARCDLIVSSRLPSTFFIASMPLIMRFIITCCNCTRSPMSWGRSAASSVRTDKGLGCRVKCFQSYTVVLQPLHSSSITLFRGECKSSKGSPTPGGHPSGLNVCQPEGGCDFSLAAIKK
jgi:hypothetical protein